MYRYTIVFRQDKRDEYSQLFEVMRSGFGSKAVFCEDIAELDADDQAIYILTALYSLKDQLISEIQRMPESILRRTIIFGYTGDDHGEFLEEYKPLGLATSKSVKGWLLRGARPSPMLSHGNGIYGLREYFDPTLFGDVFLEVEGTQHYMVYELSEAQELPRTIDRYLDAVFAGKNS